MGVKVIQTSYPPGITEFKLDDDNHYRFEMKHPRLIVGCQALTASKVPVQMVKTETA